MTDEYHKIIVETYLTADTSGKHGKIHVRPVEGEIFPQTMDVECSRTIRKEYPIGTKFRIRAKQTCREGGKPFLYSNYSWEYEVVK